jgi:hypothetical protein
MRGLFCLLLIIWGQLVMAQNLEVEGHLITEEQPYVELDFEENRPQKGYKTTLILSNTAVEPLLIKAVEGGCDCIKTRIRKKKLKQHQKTKLLIKWNPDGDTEFSGAISIQSNDVQYPELWIHLLGHL